MTTPRRNRESGFALAALIFFLTAATILLAAAVPSYQMQAKRAQEEELIFRGEEFMRAIAKYQRKVGIYPPSVDALLETNGNRFLRKAYVDPITGKPFRLIFINPDGSVSGSTMYNNTGRGQNPFGQTLPPGQQNLMNAQGAQMQPFGQAQGQRQGQQGQQPGQQQGQRQLPPGQQPGQQQIQQPGQQRGQQGQRQGQQVGQQGPPGQQAFGNPVSGTAGIIGVASDSELESVKIYNNKQHYNEWEFIAILNQPNQQQPPGQQNPQQPGQQNQQPGQPPNQPNFGINGAQPGFGQPNMPQPGFGQPRPNPNPIPNQPFGFGAPQPQQPQPPIKRPN